MLQVLDSNGLQTLIGQIQGQVLKTSKYYKVKAKGNDNTQGTVLMFQIVPASDKAPWIVKYRINSVIPSNDSTTQLGEVLLGGINNKLAYYSTASIIYDLGMLSAKSHIVINNQSRMYVGLNLQQKFNDLHDITIEYEFFKNCRITAFKNAKLISDLIADDDLSQFILKEIDFTKNGLLTSGDLTQSGDDGDIESRLSEVAFSGSYNDLTDKPQILQLQADQGEETITFSYMESE